MDYSPSTSNLLEVAFWVLVAIAVLIAIHHISCQLDLITVMC